MNNKQLYTPSELAEKYYDSFISANEIGVLCRLHLLKCGRRNKQYFIDEVSFLALLEFRKANKT
ncbi:MAG: hypothetical protein ACKVOU_03630 [Cytophagales bacterium]